MQKTRRNWFDGKYCEICKKQGIIFRLINNRKQILCDSKKCDLMSRIRARFFGGINIKGDIK